MAGSTAGAAAGFNEVVNNYLSHQELLNAKRELEGCAGNAECMGDVVQRYLALSDENLATAQADCVTSLEACQPHNLLHRDAMNALHDDRGGELFDISNEARPFLQVLIYENIGAEGAMAQAALTRFWEEQGMSPEWAAAMAALPIGLNKQVLKNRGSGGSGASNTGGNANRVVTEFVDGVTVFDRRTGITITGIVDLRSTLERIHSRGSFSHQNDGSVFQNRPLRGKTVPELPAQSPGYYTEYVHPTPWSAWPGSSADCNRCGWGGLLYS